MTLNRYLTLDEKFTALCEEAGRARVTKDQCHSDLLRARRSVTQAERAERNATDTLSQALSRRESFKLFLKESA